MAQEMITLYTAQTTTAPLMDALRRHFKDVKVEIAAPGGTGPKITVTHGGGWLSKGESVIFSTRQRQNPQANISQSSEPICRNLHGMYSYVSSFPVQNEQWQQFLLSQIPRFQIEIGVVAANGFSLVFQKAILEGVKALDGMIFSNNNSFLSSNRAGNGFWNGDGALVLDASGASDL